jgi:23S rRNA (uracil1939-C5)-methyltransferase
MQVNFPVNSELIWTLVSEARRRKAATVLDLYCGSGNFLLPLLAAGFTGVGVEVQAASIAAAKQAAEEQGWEATWHAEDVPSWLEAQSGKRDGLSFDLVVVDPPRAGLGHGARALASRGAPHLVVCSCSPKSLSNDLAALVHLGYTVDSVELFDMFAQTRHVEVLAWLSKR